jgi:hypothetical protein
MFAKRGECSVCRHKDCPAINAELTAGASTREIAEKHPDLSKSSVARHAALHLIHDDTTGQSNAGARQLEDAARRLLSASERKGDRRSTLDALKLLHEMQVRRRIAAAASSASPGGNDEPQGNSRRRSPESLCETLREIYGIKKGRAWQPPSSDERCIEELRSLVERRADTDPISCALATRLASRVLNRPLDEATEREVARLEVAEEADVQKMVGEANGDEGIDNEPSDGGDERHIDSPDVDDHG